MSDRNPEFFILKELNLDCPYVDEPHSSNDPGADATSHSGVFRSTPQNSLRNDIQDLKVFQNNLECDIASFKQGGWSVEIGPFMTKNTEPLARKLDQLKIETSALSVNEPGQQSMVTGDMSIMASNLKASNPKDSSPPESVKSVPPHLRKTNGSVPPHRRGTQHPTIFSDKILHNSLDAALRTDGRVDPVRAFTPPPSVPPTVDQPKPKTQMPIGATHESTQSWAPSALSSFPSLSPQQMSSIPPMANMTTFHPDFLRNHLGGISWSPGLTYVPQKNGVSILKNRTYYTLDARFEPYVPKTPGTHGAKLTPFFNVNPEDHFADDDGNSFQNVPLFVCNYQGSDTSKTRYVYLGNYSQSRWSDKLDYDHMLNAVPAHVKQYWAEELAAGGRDKWITEALKKHFYPKPEYEGRLPLGADDNEEATQTTTEEEVSRREKEVARDLKKYAEELKEWEKDANLRVKLIKQDFILAAFERADADDPPALRLWWEYLQCVSWDKAFYDMLVQLQNREPGSYRT